MEDTVHKQIAARECDQNGLTAAQLADRNFHFADKADIQQSSEVKRRADGTRELMTPADAVARLSS